MISIFQEMVPNGVVGESRSTIVFADNTEKASIDEAYMNLTPLIIERLIEAYPFLSEVPEDAPEGIDSPLPPAPPIDWTGAGHVLPVYAEDDDRSVDDLEDGLEDEEEREQRDNQRLTSWSDWALKIGAEIMVDLREEIWKRLHYTTSAGVAHNKAMAKVSYVLFGGTHTLIPMYYDMIRTEPGSCARQSRNQEAKPYSDIQLSRPFFEMSLSPT